MNLKEFKKEMFKKNPKIKEEYDKLDLVLHSTSSFPIN